jgi:hypothetical protein
MFVNTKCNVYVYNDTKKIDVHVVIGPPFAPTYCAHLPPIADATVVHTYAGAFIAYLYKYMQQAEDRAMVTDDLTRTADGKIKSGCPEYTIYVSKAAIDKLSPEELLAMSLYDIKHTASHFQYVLLTSMQKLLALVVHVLGLLTLIKPTILSVFGWAVVVLTFTYLASQWTTRRETFATDKFIVELGLGSSLASALSKIDKDTVLASTQSTLKTVVDKVFGVFSKVLNYLGISSTPDVGRRIEAINNQMQSQLYESVTMIMHEEDQKEDGEEGDRSSGGSGILWFLLIPIVVLILKAVRHSNESSRFENFDPYQAIKSR